MRINELKSPYRELAEMRMAKNRGFVDTNYDLSVPFNWGETKEGKDFWIEVSIDKTPEIPQYSLDELKEWQAEQNNDWDTPFNTKALSASKDDRLFTAAVAAMQGMITRGARFEVIITDAWAYAELLIKEGKERNHL